MAVPFINFFSSMFNNVNGNISNENITSTATITSTNFPNSYEPAANSNPKKEPTLVKDIMEHLEEGDRTKEQMTLMRLNEFNKMNQPSQNWNTSVGTMIMSSASSMMWSTNTGGIT